MKKWKAKQAWIETAILLVILAGVFLIQQVTGCWLDVRYEPLQFKPSVCVGKDFKTKELLEKFDAVCVTCFTVRKRRRRDAARAAHDRAFFAAAITFAVVRNVFKSHGISLPVRFMVILYI